MAVVESRVSTFRMPMDIAYQYSTFCLSLFLSALSTCTVRVDVHKLRTAEK